MKFSTKLTVAALAACVAAVPASAQMRRNIRIVGSSTVYPFTKAVSERFARANPGIPAPIVESTGTGAGAKLFCGGVGAGHPDVLNASRRIKLSEFRLCAANGVSQITEIQVGLDGLSLATSKGGPLRNVSLRDIYMAIAKAPSRGGSINQRSAAPTATRTGRPAATSASRSDSDGPVS